MNKPLKLLHKEYSDKLIKSLEAYQQYSEQLLKCPANSPSAIMVESTMTLLVKLATKYKTLRDLYAELMIRGV